MTTTHKIINEHGFSQTLDAEDGCKVCASCEAAPVPVNLGQGEMCANCTRLVDEHQAHEEDHQNG